MKTVLFHEIGLLGLLLCAMTAACALVPGESRPIGDGDSGSADGDTDSDGDMDTDTGDFQDAGCENLLPLPRPATFIEHVPGSEDFVFDKEGNLISVTIDSATVVKKTTYDGETEIVAQIDNSYPQGTRASARR